jgi:hypothetical protein
MFKKQCLSLLSDCEGAFEGPGTRVSNRVLLSVKIRQSVSPSDPL